MARGNNQVDQREIKDEREKRDFNNVIVLICLVLLTANCIMWALPVWYYIAIGFGKLFGGMAAWKTFFYFLSAVVGIGALGGGYWANRQQK